MAFWVDKQEITTDSIVSYFGFPATTAKRYLRQLTEFGYLEAYGSNKNRAYKKKGIKCQRITLEWQINVLNSIKSEADLIEFKDLLAQFVARKAQKSIDALWEEGTII